jgi:hypothetical protein
VSPNQSHLVPVERVPSPTTPIGVGLRGTGTKTVLASRVKKARRTSTCPVCRCPIMVGQQIAKRGYWQHIEHVIEPNRSTEGKRP